MTDIIDLARAAGVRLLSYSEDYIGGLERLVAAAVAAEREACAKVCEEHWHIDGEHTAYEFARVIRARGEK